MTTTTHHLSGAGTAWVLAQAAVVAGFAVLQHRSRPPRTALR